MAHNRVEREMKRRGHLVIFGILFMTSWDSGERTKRVSFKTSSTLEKFSMAIIWMTTPAFDSLFLFCRGETAAERHKS